MEWHQTSDVDWGAVLICNMWLATEGSNDVSLPIWAFLQEPKNGMSYRTSSQRKVPFNSICEL